MGGFGKFIVLLKGEVSEGGGLIQGAVLKETGGFLLVRCLDYGKKKRDQCWEARGNPEGGSCPVTNTAAGCRAGKRARLNDTISFCNMCFNDHTLLPEGGGLR